MKMLSLQAEHEDLDLAFVPDGTTGYGDPIRPATAEPVGGTVVQVAALCDIIRSKTAAGRHNDIEALPELQALTRHGQPPAAAVEPPAGRSFTGELVRIHVPQLNGCVYCVDMHSTDVRAIRETEQRLYGLAAWRETPYFTERERAALAFTESVTLMAIDHVSPAAYDAVAAQFSSDEIAAMVALVVTVNAWNAIGVSTRAWIPGSYQT